MDYEQIKSEQRDDVLVLTLNRPERLNAWTQQMSAELSDAIIAANEDATVGAIVLTGEGRGFCAGADIQDTFKSQLDGAERSAAPRPRRAVDWVSLVRSSKPLVAAVNGHAVGIGLTMILSFDYIMASDQARLSCRFIKMGLVPELASSHFLPQRVGLGRASDLMLSGRMVPAAEAGELGLVDQVVPHEQLLDAAVEKARSFAANPDLQLRMIKQLITQNALEQDMAQVQKREGEKLAIAYQSPEHKEAVSAFLEKREPKFR
jgi:2-(1,2-epoxy-1,2-dihydrophenyl)acetyl-CoA isomerase